MWTCHTCMLGGERKKSSGFLSSARSLEQTTRRCGSRGAEICLGTGRPHKERTLHRVASGGVVFPSAAEAQYPEALCDALADAPRPDVDRLPEAGGYHFIEVFSGPNAPLSAAVERLRRSEREKSPAGKHQRREGALVRTLELPSAAKGFTEKGARRTKNASEGCARHGGWSSATPTSCERGAPYAGSSTASSTSTTSSSRCLLGAIALQSHERRQ